MVWADADCACADTAIGCSPPSGAPVLRSRAADDYCRAKISTGEIGGERIVPPARTSPVRHAERHSGSRRKAVCGSMPQPRFSRRRKLMSRAYNVIDADGHILEPLDLWDKYMDPKFRDRAAPGCGHRRR